MKILRIALFTISFLLIALIACQPLKQPLEVTHEAETADEEILYVNILWHQHQPLYYQDEEGVYTRPWVRVHATKDYYDMASILKQYPDIRATFNLTPVLLKQIDDFVENGAKDKYWVLTEIPASDLDQEQKEFILTRFFDANWDNIIARFPRYQELLDKRGGSDDEFISQALETYSEQDFRDLQVWFNLAWFDPDFLAEEPLKSLVEKGENFSEADKEIIFTQVRSVMAQVVAIHKELQDSGQIEVITTPYAHPILPLLYSTDLAGTGNPSAELPARFSWPNDAIAQLQRSVEIYQEHFDRQPRGLWPAEGAVAEEVVPLIADAGYQWMATGEPVLSASLGMANFTRDSKETVQEADALYRPYYVQGLNGEKVAIFFRDWVLSDKVGFTYSQTPGEQAAVDLIQRLENIRNELKEENAEGPHIVSIVLDGENAWEYYPNDGKEFLHAFYRQLSQSATLKTITPSEYLELFPEQRELETLFPAAWFSQNYDTWIGEEQENQAWDYLGKTRDHLAKYDLTGKRTASPEAIEEAQDYMYLAEGSDWFWWYGADQTSGQDEYFDESFRALQMKVYEALGDEVPAYLYVPIIPTAAEQPATYLTEGETPEIDGVIEEGEWEKAAQYMAKENITLNSFWYTLDASNLYFRVDTSTPIPQDATLGVYLRLPNAEVYYPFTRTGEQQIGIAASHLFELKGSEVVSFMASEDGWQEAEIDWTVQSTGGTTEIQIPLNALGELEEGDEIYARLVLLPDGEVMPESGPAKITLLQVGTYTTVLEVDDPQGDDHGLGTYVYPTDEVFLPQVFDIDTFKVSYDEKNILFEFSFYGPLTNPWSSAINLSLQTLDVYVDTDPVSTAGARLLLPGRNAAIKEGAGWDVAVWAEGWYPQLLKAGAEGGSPETINVEFKILVDVANNKVTLRVPREVFGTEDPSQWAYTAMVLSQDGFPSTGVWRVRDVLSEAAQWRLGGAPQDANHTRILDLVWPEGASPTQEEMLSDYVSSTQEEAEFTADDYSQVEMLSVK